MKIVLLLGASCTGKSTLCKALSDQHDWIVADADEFHYKFMPVAYPKAINAVKPVTDALSENYHECLARYKLSEKIVDFAITRGLSFEDSKYAIDAESYYKEPIEELLKKAGVQDEDIPLLADFLHEVVKNTENLMEVMPFMGLAQFFKYYLEDAFQQQLNPNDTMLLDVNTHPEFGPDKISAALDKYVQDYRNNHHNQSRELFKVIAYCPPKILSERLQQRVESGYTGNTGEGLFSFVQISQLVTAFPYEYEESDVIDELTPKDIEKIVETHVAGASDARVFTKARHELAGKFNMKDEPVKLVANKDFPYDAIVDTSKDNAENLAKKLFKEINDCAGSKLETPRMK